MYSKDLPWYLTFNIIFKIIFISYLVRMVIWFLKYFIVYCIKYINTIQLIRNKCFVTLKCLELFSNPKKLLSGRLLNSFLFENAWHWQVFLLRNYVINVYVFCWLQRTVEKILLAFRNKFTHRKEWNKKNLSLCDHNLI